MRPGAKNLQLLPIFVCGKPSYEPHHGRHRTPLRAHARRTGRAVPRVGHAAIRRRAAGAVALRAAYRRPAVHERHSRRTPGRAGRTVPARAQRSGPGQRIGRRNQEIPVPDPPEQLRRIGLYPRRRPGHAVRLLAGRLPHGLPLLRHRAAGAATFALRARNPQPNRLAARTRTADQPGLHGDGRTARQHRQCPAGARNHHGAVGFRLVADPRHGLHGGRRTRAAPVPRQHQGPPCREPAQPFRRRTYSYHAGRAGVAHRRGGGHPARLRLHPPAAGLVRVYRHGGAQRFAAPHPRVVPPAGRHQVPHQPYPLPQDTRLALLLARRRGDGPRPRRPDRPRYPNHYPCFARRRHPGRLRPAEHFGESEK